MAAASAAWTPKATVCWLEVTPVKLARAASAANSLLAPDECEPVRLARVALGDGEVIEARVAIPLKLFNCEK